MRNSRFYSGLTVGMLLAARRCIAYDMVREYSGASFFDRWDFYGSWDNLTLGDVWWLGRQDATNQGLAYVNGAGNAIIKVDDTSNVPWNEKRNTVRITSTDLYNYGSLWIIDLVHLPFGCSVWPAFWTKGPLWPNDGEIDIIEAVNLMSANQMALHSTSGCFHATPSSQLGQSAGLGVGNVGGTGLNSDGENASDCSTGAGCAVTELKEGSFGSAFANQGGGVWATQFDVAGVYIWYWPRSQIPASIQQSTSTSSVDLADWGAPSAAYPNTSCSFPEFFTAQQLVIDITLCGDWAGVGAVYNATCANTGSTGQCYTDNVVGSGANYANAYFEIAHLRAYTTSAPSATGTAAFDSSPSGVGASSGAGDSFHMGRMYACTLVMSWVMTIVFGVWFSSWVVL